MFWGLGMVGFLGKRSQFVFAKKGVCFVFLLLSFWLSILYQQLFLRPSIHVFFLENTSKQLDVFLVLKPKGPQDEPSRDDEVDPCHLYDKPAVDCLMSDWGPWGTCDVTPGTPRKSGGFDAARELGWLWGDGLVVQGFQQKKNKEWFPVRSCKYIWFKFHIFS